MSNLSVNTITDASGGSTASINGLTPQASNMQPFNRIINGAMTIDQRNAGIEVTPNNTYTVDRFWVQNSQTGKFTAQQNAAAVAPPSGFTKYLGLTSTSAYSVGSGDYFNLQQSIEGLNCGDLAWGGASAATVTLSFRVYSSLTGTFGGSLRNSAYNRSYPFTYTISLANTWTTISLTIAGDQSGTWLTTNGIGINILFNLGTGSDYSGGTANAWNAGNYNTPSGTVSVVGTSGATFYITGVQLEAGSTASSFAHENYGDTLSKCQRYYYAFIKAGEGAEIWVTGGSNYNTTTAYGGVRFPVTMRALPSLKQHTETGYWQYYANAQNYVFNSFGMFGSTQSTASAAFIYNAESITITQGQAGNFQNANIAAYMHFDSEL